jgi:type II restriction enzyme
VIAGATPPPIPKRLKYGIAQFIHPLYRSQPYAENSRESLREDLTDLIGIGAVETNADNPARPRTSKDFNYSLTREALAVVQAFESSNWSRYVQEFLVKSGNLRRYKFQQERRGNFSFESNWGVAVSLTADSHGDLMINCADAIKELHFQDALLLLVDHALPTTYVNGELAKQLGFKYDPSVIQPDLILFVPSIKHLLFVEAVWSGGEINKARQDFFEDLLHDLKVPRIYVSAFPDFKAFKRYTSSIAWGSLVWIKEWPDHLIHYNGETLKRALQRK